MSRSDDTLELLERDAPSREARDKPFRIAVAPTIRLSDDASAVQREPTWTTSELTLFPTRAVRPKPPTLRSNLTAQLRPKVIGFFRREERLSAVPSFIVDRGHVIMRESVYRRSNFTQRVRERGIALCLFAAVSALLCLVTPFGLAPCALSFAVAWAEMKVGWTQLSNAATRLVGAAMVLSLGGIVYQTVYWVTQLVVWIGAVAR
ncbi:MAG: hypothetical protein O3A46_13180 [Candidatus Poribacteria bacterium]|nr:hypothetical protein [Candidatus Poribacteria bacterium]